MKKEAVYPAKGLGSGSTERDKAILAIKKMASSMIELAIFDEAAAMSGRRPLEQIADCSGIAWGGSCLQMVEPQPPLQMPARHWLTFHLRFVFLSCTQKRTAMNRQTKFLRGQR